jgi:hypothetical protein
VSLKTSAFERFPRFSKAAAADTDFLVLLPVACS